MLHRRATSTGVKSSRRRVLAAGVVGLMLMGAAGCGDSEESAAPSQNGDAGASSVVADARAFIEENAPGARELPTDAPTPPENLDVWVIPCASAASGCQDVADGVEAAGKVLNWNVTVFDGQGDPARWAAGIEQATVAGADAIVTGAIDCAPVKQALTKARTAEITTVNVAGFDCDDGELFTSTTMPADGETDWTETAKRSGALQAAWAIQRTDGDVKAIQFTNKEQALTVNLAAGFKERMDACDTCEILASEEFLLAELGPPLVEKANGALLKSPDANVIATPYDPAAAPVAQAVVNAGRGNDVSVLGSIGAPASIELIRAGRGQAMAAGWDVRWLGWAALDDIIRIRADQEPAYSGWALGIVDSDNLPEEDQYHAPADYEANYASIWGAG